MFHRQEIAVNKSTGVPISDVIVRVFDATNNPVTIYADANQTPIVSVSGIDNAAVADDDGNYSYYVSNGVYTERLYVGDAELYSIPDLVCQGLVTTIQTPTFDDAGSLTTSSDTNLVILSGTSAIGDSGTGRQFAYDATVDSTYVTANPATSFIDVTGRGFKEIAGSSAVGLSAALAATTGAGLVGTSDGSSVQQALAARPTAATLAANGGAASIGTSSGGTLQSQLDNFSAFETTQNNSGSLASQLSALGLPYPNAAATYVPQGAAAFSLTSGGSGGTNGTNILATYSGGTLATNPTIYFDIVGGIVQNVRMLSGGLYIGSGTPTMPTVTLPGSAGAATLTLTAGKLVPTGSFYWTLSSDGTQALYWQNNAGTPSAYPSSGAQASFPLNPAVANFGMNMSEALEALYDLILTDSAAAFTRGTYTASGTTVSASLKGWRSPFKHNGAAFNAVQFTLKAQAASTRVLVKILDSSLNELARGYGIVGTTATAILVPLNQYVRGLAANAIGYISYEPADTGGVLGYPAGNGTTNIYPVGDADPATYHEYYMGTDNAWHQAAPTGDYCIPFRAMNFKGAITPGAFSALYAQVLANIGLITTGSQAVYYVAGLSGYDSTYTAAGAGTQIAAQAADITFNKLTVYGGCPGAGQLRGYLVDPATAATHVPGTSDTLLFTTAINWTSGVGLQSVVLPQTYTIPAGKELHLLWVATTSGQSVSVARWTTNAGGNEPRMRFATTHAGDATNIWNDSWYDGGNAFWTVPPKLELVAAGSQTTVSAPIFTIPSVINAVVGTELNLYYDGLFSARSRNVYGIDGYSVAIVGAKGKNYKRGFQWTPASGDAGTLSLTALAWDATTTSIRTQSFAINVVAATPKASPKNVLYVSDSLGAAGVIGLTVQKKFIDLGGTVPTFVGTQCTKLYQFIVSGITTAPLVNATYTNNGATFTITNIYVNGGAGVIVASSSAGAPSASGTLTRTSGAGDASIAFSASSGPAPNEAYGGKTYSYFATSGGVSYNLNVTGIGSVSAGAVYLIGGINYTVFGSNLSGGAGTIQISGASAPPTSGTGTLVSGTGDATITYSSFSTVAGNPFWNAGTSALDIANYRSVNSIAAVIDGVVMMLGINDVFGSSVLSSGQITTIINYAKSLCTAFLADNAACKIIVALPSICAADDDGFAANYGAAYSRPTFEANLFALRAALLTAFDAGAFNANVSIGGAGLQVDRWYGYQQSTKSLAARISGTETTIINAVHPATQGYQQIGDAIFAGLMAKL